MRKLCYYPLCGCSRTALLMLSEKKLDFSVEITRFWDRSSGLLALNSFGRLPVLVDLNGSVAAGIYAITTYLEDVYPDIRLFPEDLVEKLEACRIIQWIQEDFSNEVVAPLVFERDIKRHFSSVNASPASQVMRDVRDATARLLPQIEALISQRNWLAGSVMSLADLTAAAHLSVVDYLGGIFWKNFPVLKEWYVRLKSRPSFKRLLTDHVPGLPPVSYYSDLDF